MDHSYGNISDSELEMVYADNFGHTAHFAPRESLLEALDTQEPLNHYDIIHAMGNALSTLVAKHWKRIQTQLKCGGYCFDCSKGRIIDCYLANQEYTEDSTMTECKLAPNKKYTLEELEETGALKDRRFMMMFLQYHTDATAGKLIHTDPKEIVDWVKETAAGFGTEGEEEVEEKEEKEEEKEKKEEKPKRSKRGRPKSKAKTESKDNLTLDEITVVMDSKFSELKQELNAEFTSLRELIREVTLYHILLSMGPEFAEAALEDGDSPFVE